MLNQIKKKKKKKEEKKKKKKKKVIEASPLRERIYEKNIEFIYFFFFRSSSFQPRETSYSNGVAVRALNANDRDITR